MSDTIITVTDAAGILGVSDRRVRQLLQSGELPGRRVGPDGPRGIWEIRRADAEKFKRRPVGAPKKQAE